MTTAICLRALLCGNGNGQAIDSGLTALANLQKPEGIWPGMPVLRMPVDPFASAFLLLRLGDCEAFQNAIRLDAAIEWFESNAPALDQPTASLWSHAKRRLPRGKAMPTVRVSTASARHRLSNITPNQMEIPSFANEPAF
jgi:hypothetical protein